MHPIVSGVVAGVAGTVVMDVLNRLAAASGAIAKIDLPVLGRMAAGWARGRFRYADPGRLRPVARETLLGLAAHYGIGIALAVPFVLGWEPLVGGSASPWWALAWGIATTAASWFFVYPSLGLGICGRRAPDSPRPAVSSLANHVFYGLGLAGAVALLG